jgi:ribosomal protein L7/L12
MSAAVGIILFIVLLLLIGGGGFFAWSYGYVGGQIIGGECEENDDCRNENCIEEKCRNIDLALGKKCDDDNLCKDDGSLFCSSAGICTAIPSSSSSSSTSPGTLGAVCDTTKPCAPSLVCTDGKCATATSTNTPVGTSGKLGSSCANVACDTGLKCGTSNICENPPSPVHCVMSEWESSPCDKPCGGGFITRTRTITRPASNGGNPCGPTDEKIACNTHACQPSQRENIDITSLYNLSDRIRAIGNIRSLLGIGLKDAKDLVDIIYDLPNFVKNETDRLNKSNDRTEAIKIVRNRIGVNENQAAKFVDTILRYPNMQK